MRYLELPQLATLNTILSRIEADDGSRISGRAEAFSAKAAGADRKLWRHLEGRFGEQLVGGSGPEILDNNQYNNVPSSPPGPGIIPSTTMSHVVVGGVPLKHLYYLIATMNMVFPDYDFSDVDPKYFKKIASLPQTMQSVNNSIQNSGITKSTAVLMEFSRNVWDSIDAAINLDDCDIYSFDPQEDDFVDDPFTIESGCM